MLPCGWVLALHRMVTNDSHVNQKIRIPISLRFDVPNLDSNLPHASVFRVSSRDESRVMVA